MTPPQNTVFLLDVDNTLLDNDRGIKTSFYLGPCAVTHRPIHRAALAVRHSGAAYPLTAGTSRFFCRLQRKAPMLRSTNDLKQYVIGATDGEIGQVKDFFFDDERWVVRYLVVETGEWLSSRKVLISPFAISRPEWAEKIMPVSITKEQVKNSPDVDTERPVSRQHEMQYTGYYGYPTYWGGAGLWGGGLYPDVMMAGYGYGGYYGSPSAAQMQEAENRARAEAVRHESDDPHLRSCKAVAGYHIHAADGDIGHVQGFLVEDDTWAIRYLIVDTSNWWLGHQVLIAPQWIKEVSWSQRTVSVDLTRQAVRDAPPYDSAVPLDRKQELQIYAHHRRPLYWADGLQRENEISRV